jgi:hypothetical protein
MRMFLYLLLVRSAEGSFLIGGLVVMVVTLIALLE